MSKLKEGDSVRLAAGNGCLVDYETGFEISGEQIAKIGAKIGTRTNAAFVSGGLVLISGKAPVAEPAKKPAAKKTAAKTAEKTADEQE